MKPRLLRELTLYRFRYLFGYGIFIVVLALSMVVSIGSIPEGVSQAEADSAVKSMQMNPRAISPIDVVDVPYHALQKATISTLGLTQFSIKLPSILISIATGICLVVMLRKWFRDNVAVVSGLLAVTAIPFLTTGRTGTALIMTFFWTTLLLLSATRVLHSKRLSSVWKAVGLVSGIALLYTPLGIYPLIALIVSGLLHPHVRHLFRTTRPITYILLVMLAILSITPLVMALTARPEIGLMLLGIDISQFTLSAVAANAKYLAALFFNPLGNGIENGMIVPLFGIATLALVFFGALSTLKERHSARSYMIFIWLGFLLPILLINPNLPYVIFIPVVLLLAVGTETLIRDWYDIFPFNPYARIGALLPLAILLGSIMTTNLFRYYYGNVYAAHNVSDYHQLATVRSSLDRDDVNKSSYRLITDKNTEFYDLLRRDYPKLEVTSTPVILAKGTTVRVGGLENLDTAPYRILTNGDATDGKVLSLYVKW